MRSMTANVIGRDLLDWVRWQLDLPTDRALAATLGMHPPQISALRHHPVPAGPALLLRVLEAVDLSPGELMRSIE